MLAVKKVERGALFLLGGGAYIGLELAWRGATHWTMFLLGGACLCWLDWMDTRLCLPLWRSAALGAAGVTGMELATGLLCNRLLRMQIWDYSKEWGNLAGAVCPRFALLWYLLCLWVLFWLRALGRRYRPARP